MLLKLILPAVVLIALVATLPIWPHSKKWGLSPRRHQPAHPSSFIPRLDPSPVARGASHRGCQSIHYFRGLCARHPRSPVLGVAALAAT